MRETPVMRIVGLGTGDIVSDRSGVELNLKTEDGTQTRVSIERQHLEQLTFAFQSLLAKLDQFNPDHAIVGETLDVIPIEAQGVLVGQAEDGRIGIRFESKGMSPTVVLDRKLAQELRSLLKGQISRSRKSPPSTN